MQVDLVVPFAHAFGAQPELDGSQRPLEAGVGMGGFFFCGRQRFRAGRHADGPAQLFQGQLLIKAAGGGD